ncbi:diguanylate cyclase [Chryseomicrobium aureum]|uniref:sensor domain-containing diguanylate cyclase n=1 Tax=Chryseomicrobium aureum TaxID=1441723 RepID=UPI00370DCF83
MEAIDSYTQIQSAWSTVHSDAKKAARISQNILNTTTKKENALLYAQAEITLAFCHAHEGKNAEALSLVNQTLQVVEHYQSIEWIVNAKRVIGYVYSSLGDLKRSGDAFEEGLYLIKKYDLPIDPHYLNNLGFIYYELGEFKQAHNQLLEALAVAQEQQHDIVPLLLSNVADLHLQFGEIDEAEEFNKQAFTILQTKVEDRNSLAHCHSIFGLISKHKRHWEEAYESFALALKMYQEQDAKYAVATILIDMGGLYSDQGHYTHALENYKEALEIAESLEAVLLTQEILQRMSDVYYASEEYKRAYQYLLRYNEVTEQIKTKEVKDQLSRYMTEAQVERMQREAEIERLQLKRESEEASIRAQVLEDSYQDLKTVSEIGRRIIANQEDAEAMYSVYLDLNRLMDADIFGLCLYNKETQEVEYRAFVEQGILLSLSNKSIQDTSSLSVRCIRENQEIHIRKAVVDEDYTLRESGFPDKNPRSIHFLPLSMNDETIGSMTVQSYEQDAFSERQIEMLRLLALYLSIAMSNMLKSEELQLQTRKLEHLAKTDPLTNLYNMRHMKQLLTQSMETYHKSNKSFSILVIDLDHFKEVNDSHGHSCGDFVLQALSRHFQSFTRQSDVTARWGGEEFLMLLPNTDLQDARTIGERLRQSIEELEIRFNTISIHITATIGIATYSSKDWHVDELIERADKALYIGKEAGRNQVVAYGSE